MIVKRKVGRPAKADQIKTHVTTRVPPETAIAIQKAAAKAGVGTSTIMQTQLTAINKLLTRPKSRVIVERQVRDEVHAALTDAGFEGTHLEFLTDVVMAVAELLADSFGESEPSGTGEEQPVTIKDDGSKGHPKATPRKSANADRKSRQVRKRVYITFSPEARADWERKRQELLDPASQVEAAKRRARTHDEKKAQERAKKPPLFDK